MYVVYIRVTHNRQVKYIRTSWMVDDKGLSRDKQDVIDPFVSEQTSKVIAGYYHMLNRLDTQNWTAKEIVEFIQFGKDGIALTSRSKEKYPINIRQIHKAAMLEYNDEDRGILLIQNPWSKITITKGDTPNKRAITPSMLRKLFGIVPDFSRFTHPLQELGQDVALMSFCMCGINSIDLFYAEKSQYYDGILHYNRRKTCKSRSDNAYFEIRVPQFIIPTFEKYLSKDKETPWLFDFHNRLSNADFFNANVNAGISQICKKVSPGFHASLYSFRHSWATVAQNGCGASLSEIDFALNHSTNKMARVYTMIDYSPAWELNDKVIDYIFFSNKEPGNNKDTECSFERMSKYNLIRGEVFINGERVSVIEDTGFRNVDQIITLLLTSLQDETPRPTKVQIKISNLDKQQTQLYQRVLQ